MNKPALMAMLCLVTSVACGDDDSGDGAIEPDAGMDASMGGTGGRPGTGGAAPPMMMPLPVLEPFFCGDVECVVPGAEFGIALFPPCCTGDNECGLIVMSPDADAGGGECVPRPPSDPRCPDVDVLGVMQPGCCIEDLDICGVNGAQTGMGCIENPLGGLLGGMSVRCSDEDAGADPGEDGGA